MMTILGDIKEDLIVQFEICSRKMMAKRNVPKTTPEDEAQFDENLRRLRERIAEREARSASWRTRPRSRAGSTGCDCV